MNHFLHNREHLARMAGLFCLGIAGFFLVRYLLVPEGFGTYGHYRAGALVDNMNMPVRYAGAAACADCHSDVVEARKGNKHVRIACEACHGALAAHVKAVADVIPQLPDGRELCLRCHLANVARPKTFPQIAIPDHGDGSLCLTCHNPHAPAIL
jgi:predicted CXXCH cytochrome family protein